MILSQYYYLVSLFLLETFEFLFHPAIVYIFRSIFFSRMWLTLVLVEQFSGPLASVWFMATIPIQHHTMEWDTTSLPLVKNLSFSMLCFVYILPFDPSKRRMLIAPPLKSSGLYISGLMIGPIEGRYIWYKICSKKLYFLNISDKPLVYSGRTYILNIFYASNISKLDFFIYGSILTP